MRLSEHFYAYPPAARAGAILVLLVSIWHLFLAGQAGLSVDEAHYALYALKPDWSYFDHPPLVGWLQIPFVTLSQSDWALRIAPILLFALINLLSYQLAMQGFENPHPWLGFWTLALINSAVMFQLLGLAMLPETPLLVFGLLSALTLLKIRQHNTLKHWLWLGVWLGLAGLSKYTAIMLVLSIALIMLIEKRFYWLKTPGPWLGALIALLLISPVLYWNSQNDWISFAYQFEHGTRDPDWSFTRALASQGAQFIVYTPLLYFAGLVLMVGALWRWTEYRFLALFALPVIILFAYSSGHKLTLPHWTAFAFLILAPVVAHWAIRSWQQGWVRWRVYISSAIALCLAFILNTLLALPWLVSAPNHPLQELYGWDEAYQRAQAWQTHIAQHTGDKPPLFVTNWTHASRLAWQAHPQPVYVTDTRFDQFDLWFGEPAAGSSGLMVNPSYGDRLRFERPGHFARCDQLETLYYTIKGRNIVSYDLYHCHNYQPAHR